MRKYVKKLGSVTKSSDYGAPPVMPVTVPEPQLLSVSHYHHNQKRHPRPVEFHDEMQCIELVTDGRGWVESAGEWVEVTPGALLWHVTGDFTIGRTDFENPYSCLAVRFYGGTIWKRELPHVTRWEELDEVRRFTREVVRLYAHGSLRSNVLMHYILGRLQFQAELFIHEQNRRDLPGELRQAMELMEQNYGRSIRLHEVARAVGWSVPHLHDRFKAVLGISPHQALIRRRIQAARELLANTNEPVKSVASQCGFPTAAAFCAQFKKMTDLSPKEYRTRQRYGV